MTQKDRSILWSPTNPFRGFETRNVRYSLHVNYQWTYSGPGDLKRQTDRDPSEKVGPPHWDPRASGSLSDVRGSRLDEPTQTGTTNRSREGGVLPELLTPSTCWRKCKAQETIINNTETQKIVYTLSVDVTNWWSFYV